MIPPKRPIPAHWLVVLAILCGGSVGAALSWAMITGGSQLSLAELIAHIGNFAYSIGDGVARFTTMVTEQLHHLTV